MRALNVYLTKEPVALRSHFDNIPTTLGEWRAVGEAVKLSDEMVEELGTDLYLDRRYVREAEGSPPWLSVHVAYYTGMIDAVPHVPDRCLVAGGFNARTRPVNYPLSLDRGRWTTPTAASGPAAYPRYTFLDGITRAPVTVNMPLGDFELRTTEFSHDDEPEARIFAGYFFVANGRIAATPEQVKLLAFRKSERYAYYCKVQFFTMGDREMTPEAFTDRATDLLEVLLPELMRCLPDWAEVEARDAGAASPETSSAA